MPTEQIGVFVVPRCQGLCGSQKLDLHIGWQHRYKRLVLAISNPRIPTLNESRRVAGRSYETRLINAATTTAVSLRGHLLDQRETV